MGTTQIILQVILGAITVLLMIGIARSTKIPGARQMQVITLLGSTFTVISNVYGKAINKKNGKHKWELLDLGKAENKNGKIRRKRLLNIYFYPYPFFKTYTYEFTYTKLKKNGEQKKGDIVIWESTKTNDIVVARTGISNHIEYRYEYPVVTTNLQTEELAAVEILTTDVIEAHNPVEMLFGINDWFSLVVQSLGGRLRGLVAKKKIKILNALSSEDQPEFNKTMAEVNQDVQNHPGLLTFGVELIKSIFVDFNPADENAKNLMNSYTNVEIAKETGNAILEKQKPATEAFLLQSNAEIDQSKKRLIETGRVKVNEKNEITELVPDPDKKVLAENIGKLSSLKGTLVLGADTTNMLNLNKKGGE